MRPIPNTEIDEAQAMLKPIIRQKRMVQAGISIPLDEIDFSACHVKKVREPVEGWGATEYVTHWEIDLAGATWEGQEVSFEGDNYFVAECHVMETYG